MRNPQMISSTENASSDQTIDEKRSLSRRSFLRRAGVATGATVALASGGVLLRTGQTAAGQQADLDLEFNFALNLEYLEASCGSSITQRPIILRNKSTIRRLRH
jgi:hypothetical protein